MKAEKTEFEILECNKGVTLSEPSLTDGLRTTFPESETLSDIEDFLKS